MGVFNCGRLLSPDAGFALCALHLGRALVLVRRLLFPGLLHVAYLGSLHSPYPFRRISRGDFSRIGIRPSADTTIRSLPELWHFLHGSLLGLEKRKDVSGTLLSGHTWLDRASLCRRELGFESKKQVITSGCASV